MFRKMVFSMVAMVVAIGFVYADEYSATITKVEGDKVTVQKYKKAAAKGQAPEKDGDPITLNAKDAKVVFGTVKKGKAEAGDAVEGGLSNKMFSSPKGQKAFITTDADNKKITQILITKKKAK